MRNVCSITMCTIILGNGRAIEGAEIDEHHFNLVNVMTVQLLKGTSFLQQEHLLLCYKGNGLSVGFVG